MPEDYSEYASGIEMDSTMQFLFQSPIKTVDAAKNVNLTVNFTIEINENEQTKEEWLRLLKASLKKNHQTYQRIFVVGNIS